jgi:NAD(P)-dependent dehydrogenase (short-subunit alcohol dehydrogenase family)
VLVSNRFVGRRVLVTGGGRGIGRAVALGFAAEGASVAVVARTTAQVESVAVELAASGAPALAVTCDVSDEGQVDDCFNAVIKSFGGLDVVINAAGVFDLGPTESFPADTARSLLDTNVIGTFLCCRAAGRHMLAHDGGRIVNFASLLAFTAFPERAIYAASKGGTLQLTKALGIEWASRGVNVNAVAPGMIKIETPHPRSLNEEDIVRRVPAGRLGVTTDLVGPVLFLSSDDATYICGQTLVVDGGWLSYGYL